MAKEYRLLPECFGDTVLIKSLGFGEPNHKPSNGDVANSFKKQFQHSLAIGIVDDDKQKPKYFEEFNVRKTENGLICKKHPQKPHHLIIIQPALEIWITENANLAGLDMGKYGFGDPKYFRDTVKSIVIHKNKEFLKLLNDIKQAKPAPYLTLYRWIDDILI